MPPAKKRKAPIDRFTDASPTAISAGFSAAMNLGPQPKGFGPLITNTAGFGDFALAPIGASPGSSSGSTWLQNLQYASGVGGDFAAGSDDDGSEGEGNTPGKTGAASSSKAANSKAKKASTNAAKRKKGPASLAEEAAAAAAAAPPAPDEDDEEAAARHRKAQNRIAQREFRQRKQQYVRALETRVELLSSDHDTQVDRLRHALRGLLAENNTLRSMLGSFARFIGEGLLGGPLQQNGMTRQQLIEIIHGRSEKTMTEEWQNWPGAKECDALRQLRQEANIPVDGLPDARNNSPGPGSGPGPGPSTRARASPAGVGESSHADKASAGNDGSTGRGQRAPKSKGMSTSTRTSTPDTKSPAMMNTSGSVGRDGGGGGVSDPVSGPQTQDSVAAASALFPASASRTAATNADATRPPHLAQPATAMPTVGHSLGPSRSGGIVGGEMGNAFDFPGTEDAALMASLFGAHSFGAFGSAGALGSAGTSIFGSAAQPQQHLGASTLPILQSSSAPMSFAGFSPLTMSAGPPAAASEGTSPLQRYSSSDVSTRHPDNSTPTATTPSSHPTPTTAYQNSVQVFLQSLREMDNRQDSVQHARTIAHRMNGLRASMVANAAGPPGDAPALNGSQPQTEEEMERMTSACIQMCYHMTNYRRNASYRLPALLRPTDLQLGRSHDPLIDGIPFAGLRDALIGASERGDLDEILFHLMCATRIGEGDEMSETTWELDHSFLLRYPFLATKDAIAATNRWRKSVPKLRPLTAADITALAGTGAEGSRPAMGVNWRALPRPAAAAAAAAQQPE
ncbi:unnamed protein product [Parajaminaea phylloscopi]